jgi:hypothetical protein
MIRNRSTLWGVAMAWCAMLANAAVSFAAVNIALVPVGNPGSANDPATGYGRVDYAYDIAKYDVTAGQYGDWRSVSRDSRRELRDGRGLPPCRLSHVQRPGNVGDPLLGISCRPAPRANLRKSPGPGCRGNAASTPMRMGTRGSGNKSAVSRAGVPFAAVAGLTAPAAETPVGRNRTLTRGVVRSRRR